MKENLSNTKKTREKQSLVFFKFIQLLDKYSAKSYIRIYRLAIITYSNQYILYLLQCTHSIL